jgi:flagellar motor switch protein FliN/FliY
MSNPTVKKAAKSAAKPDAAEDLNQQAATATAEADPWAEALAEQQAAAAPVADAKPAAAPRNAGADVFQPLSANADGVNARELELIKDIPVKLSVELGRTRLTIKQLLELAQGSVVELDGLPGEPMDILINGYLIAQGEVVVVEDKFGIRITEIITPSERLQRLNR